jgi:hypothetical protein
MMGGSWVVEAWRRCSAGSFDGGTSSELINCVGDGPVAGTRSSTTDAKRSPEPLGPWKKSL